MVKNMSLKKSEFNQLELPSVHDPTSYNTIIIHSFVEWNINNRKNSGSNAATVCNVVNN